MKSTVFASLSEQRKADVRQFFNAWKRDGSRPDLMEEGLRVLSSDPRESASSLIDSGSEVAGICCTYGKGPRAKLSLPRELASKLLGLVTKIRSAGAEEQMTARMISRAFSILLDGRFPLNGQPDEDSRRLLDVLGVHEPGLRQGTLF